MAGVVSVQSKILIRDIQQASVNVMTCTVFISQNSATFYFFACCCWTLQTQQEALRQRYEIRDKEATASEGRNRPTIIDCQKCQPLSACEWGVWNMLCDTPSERWITGAITVYQPLMALVTAARGGANSSVYLNVADPPPIHRMSF